ncbi:MAG: biotin/lipoyl-containing protein [Chryseolinea sp.]
MYQALVNATATHEVTVSDSGVMVDGRQLSWDLARISDRHYHFIHESKSYSLELVSEDPSTKTFVFKLDGAHYVVRLRDKFDLLMDKLGLNGTAAGKVNNVKAPMPGLIIELRVVEGQSVRAGDPLLILEAMKMENIIKAPADSIIKLVKIKKGDSVEKNQVLIEF